jgi:hypothetical protein
MVGDFEDSVSRLLDDVPLGAKPTSDENRDWARPRMTRRVAAGAALAVVAVLTFVTVVACAVDRPSPSAPMAPSHRRPA